jgi:hypothetical protein
VAREPEDGVPTTEPTMRKVRFDGILVGEFEASGDPNIDLERMRAVLRAKGLEPRLTQTQAMFSQAAVFYETAAVAWERVKANPRRRYGGVPFVVNGAFAIELYLKTLFHLAERSERGHELLKLYDALPDETRAHVVAVAQRLATPRIKVPDGAAFRAFLVPVNDAFVEWRYLYETGETEMVHPLDVIFVLWVLHETCKELGA